MATTKSRSHVFGPAELPEGDNVVKVQATDSEGASVTDTVTVTVDAKAADFDASASIFALDVQQASADPAMLASM